MKTLYVYGFTIPPAPAAARDYAAALGPGMDPKGPPFVQTCGKVAAVVSLLARADFCGPAGEANLRNLAWLGPRACQQQAVLNRMMHHGPVWPARFGTLFSSRTRLTRFLHHNEDTIADFLGSVREHEEWAIKGFCDESRAAAGVLDGLRAQDNPKGGGPGQAYLRGRHLHQRAQDAVAGRLARAIDDLKTRLSPLATAVSERRILTVDLPGTKRRALFHWAFLLPRKGVPGFRRRVEEANARPEVDGFRLELSGPWPPCSFCPLLAVE